MNTYCTERKYGSEALTDGFKEKFSNFFVKKYEGKEVEEADFTSDLHFNLDTAFNASVDLKNAMTSQFATKESEYKNQIDELNKKIAKPQPQQQQFELPEEVKNQLAELQQFKTEQSKLEKRKAILELAKKSVREDHQSSFVEYAEDFEVDLTKEDKEQADALVAKYQKVMRPIIGDIKPLAPRQIQKRDEEILDSIKEVKVC